MKMRLVHLSFLLGTSLLGHAQIEIERQLISPWGMTTTGTIKVDASIGEVLVGEASAMNIGFQQPAFGGTTSFGEFEGKEFEYEFYPNPTDRLLTFRWSETRLKDVWLELFSADGRRLQRTKLKPGEGTHTIEVGDLANGILAARLSDGRHRTILTHLILKH